MDVSPSWSKAAVLHTAIRGFESLHVYHDRITQLVQSATMTR